MLWEIMAKMLRDRGASYHVNPRTDIVDVTMPGGKVFDFTLPTQKTFGPDSMEYVRRAYDSVDMDWESDTAPTKHIRVERGTE
jgi:hypothetical protein